MSLLQAACRQKAALRAFPALRTRSLATDPAAPAKGEKDILAPEHPTRDVMVADAISGAPSTSSLLPSPPP